jgi:uncharacterized membrane protein YvlD (DUF360 family)
MMELVFEVLYALLGIYTIVIIKRFFSLFSLFVHGQCSCVSILTSYCASVLLSATNWLIQIIIGKPVYL